MLIMFKVRVEKSPRQGENRFLARVDYNDITLEYSMACCSLCQVLRMVSSRHSLLVSQALLMEWKNGNQRRIAICGGMGSRKCFAWGKNRKWLLEKIRMHVGRSLHSGVMLGPMKYLIVGKL